MACAPVIFASSNRSDGPTYEEVRKYYFTLIEATSLARCADSTALKFAAQLGAVRWISKHPGGNGVRRWRWMFPPSAIEQLKELNHAYNVSRRKTHAA